MYEIRVARRPWADGVDFLIMERTWGQNNPNANKRIVTALTVSDVPPHQFVEPTLTMTDDMAQQLMDNLWAAGLRPSDAKATPGALAATEKHLDDMRKLVFDGGRPQHDEGRK